ncbi:MAG: nitroreductase [Firmicutes bacterium]|nr:nitroreductase [Bacillota bacterium]
MPLAEDHLQAMRRACAERLELAKGARVILAPGPADRVFTGLAIKGVPAFLAMVGDTAAPHIEEAAGYLGEYVVLTAASSGLSTCWVSATFRPEEAAKSVNLEPAEKIFAVSPLGYEGQAWLVETFFNTMVSKSRTRKPLEELLSADSMPLSSSPRWARVALEAARLAPSAYNRQPWRFTIGPNSIRVSIDPESREVKGAPKQMDCGMAMMHLEIGALAAGVTGEWEFLDTPDVAVFTVGS